MSEFLHKRHELRLGYGGGSRPDVPRYFARGFIYVSSNDVHNVNADGWRDECQDDRGAKKGKVNT
ncbi:hypothetical protein ZHAS_00019721 [Anopheles sinensis]|uniref:Uncharacterized protein n=1 Tax=Anopheles sinensis TaxID=74873 RepID=A0A084WMD8_ANOSI|nr:hypothetical protein ZHAS_00019721 [Anopheles sinensis]